MQIFLIVLASFCTASSIIYGIADFEPPIAETPQRIRVILTNATRNQGSGGTRQQNSSTKYLQTPHSSYKVARRSEHFETLWTQITITK